MCAIMMCNYDNRVPQGFHIWPMHICTYPVSCTRPQTHLDKGGPPALVLYNLFSLHKISSMSLGVNAWDAHKQKKRLLRSTWVYEDKECICICKCISMCACICKCMCMCICICKCLWIAYSCETCIWRCVCVNASACVHAYVNVSLCVHAYINAYVCACIYLWHSSGLQLWSSCVWRWGSTRRSSHWCCRASSPQLIRIKVIQLRCYYSTHIHTHIKSVSCNYSTHIHTHISSVSCNYSTHIHTHIKSVSCNYSTHIHTHISSVSCNYSTHIHTHISPVSCYYSIHIHSHLYQSAVTTQYSHLISQLLLLNTHPYSYLISQLLLLHTHPYSHLISQLLLLHVHIHTRIFISHIQTNTLKGYSRGWLGRQTCAAVWQNKMIHRITGRP